MYESSDLIDLSTESFNNKGVFELRNSFSGKARLHWLTYEPSIYTSQKKSAYIVGYNDYRNETLWNDDIYEIRKMYILYWSNSKYNRKHYSVRNSIFLKIATTN